GGGDGPLDALADIGPLRWHRRNRRRRSVGRGRPVGGLVLVLVRLPELFLQRLLLGPQLVALLLTLVAPLIALLLALPPLLLALLLAHLTLAPQCDAPHDGEGPHPHQGRAGEPRHVGDAAF